MDYSGTWSLEIGILQILAVIEQACLEGHGSWTLLKAGLIALFITGVSCTRTVAGTIVA